MALARAAFAALIAPDLHRVFEEVGEEYPLEYPSWCNVTDMEWNPIKDQQISGLGTLVPKPEGIQFTLDEPVLGANKSIEATPFGLAIEIPWELWRDELYGVMRDEVAELSRSARHRQEVDAADLLNSGFVTTNRVGFDGLALFNTAHPILKPTTGILTQANRPSPDIALSVTGIQSALLRFETQVNEAGLPMRLKPSQIIIHPNNKYVAREILGSSGKPYTADNEINALVQEDMSWMVSHYLTSQTAWFMLATKGSHDLTFYWRDRTIFDSFDDPRTKTAVFTVYQRHVADFSSYRGTDGSNP